MDDQFAAGYLDGSDLDEPEPGPNRSHAYRHAFEVARREREGRHWPAHVARARASEAIKLDRN